MAARTQSPSSINLYKQCPRKYYYIYIEKKPTKPSIHLVRGTIVHETLENFFLRVPKFASGDNLNDLQHHALGILKERWLEHQKEIDSLGMTVAEITSYKEETVLMIINWVNHLWNNLRREMSSGMTFEDALKRHTPRMEEEYLNRELNVRGYIDAIHERDGEVHIRDYKTSKKPVITQEYKLQLSIYALLYEKKHGVVPDTVGIFFLKYGEELMKVNDELLKEADLEIRWVHERTQTTAMGDYTKKQSPLCHYCDFYDLCWTQREIKDY